MNVPELPRSPKTAPRRHDCRRWIVGFTMLSGLTSLAALGQTTTVRPPTDPSRATPLWDIAAQPVQAQAGGTQAQVEFPIWSFWGKNRPLEEAEVKLGRLYLDLRSISASYLYSDNIYLLSANRRAGDLSVVRVSGFATYDFKEGLQFSSAGTLLFLPHKGRAGVSGFGIYDPLAEFYPQSVFGAQVNSQGRAGEWELRMRDRYSINAGLPRPSGISGFQINDDEHIGRHYFREQAAMRGASTYTFFVRQNEASVGASRMLPTETRMTLTGARSDYSYIGSMGDLRQRLPGSRNSAEVQLDSERQNLRLKPFVSYRTESYDNGPFTHEIKGGVGGPLSDYLDVRAQAGYFWARDLNRKGPMWNIRLINNPRELTTQELSYSRSLADLTRDLDERATYSVRQGLNQRLTGRWQAYTNWFEMLKRRTTNGRSQMKGREVGTALGLDAAVLPEGGISLEGGYDETKFNDPRWGHSKGWLGRLRTQYKTLQGDLMYRYERHQGEFSYLSYRENLVVFTVTKSF